MIIEKHKEELKSNSDYNSITFGIDTSEHIMPIFIDFLSRLYTNPLQTLMYEYVQNALDSHTMANKEDVPIKITLPNKLDPHYIVRDYGVSMNHDEVKNIFSQALKSTKRNNNKTIGGYGVGKLVFSPYCGVMFLTTWKHGIKTIYQCRLKDGNGEITTILKENSDEEQGVEIKIPVPEKDFNIFYNKAKLSYAFLKTKPIIKGFDINLNLEYFFKTDKYSLLKNKNLNSIATIGNIPFNIDPTNFKNIDYELKSILNRIPVILHFDVGEIDHTPSRDNLEYNDKTVNKILERLKELGVFLKKFITEDINESKTIYKARIKYCQYFNNYSHIYQLSKYYKICDDIIYKGEKIESKISLLKIKSIDEIYIYDIVYNKLVKKELKELYFSYLNTKFILVPYNFSARKRSIKLKKYLLEKNKELHQVILLSENYTIDDFISETDIPLDEIVDIVDIEDIEDFKEHKLSIPSKNTKGLNKKRETKKGKILQYDFNSCEFSKYVDLWNEVEFDYKNNSGYYVLIKFFKPEDKDVETFVKTMKILKENNPDLVVYGIKNSEKNKINDSMIHISELVNSLRDKLNKDTIKYRNIFYNTQWVNPLNLNLSNKYIYNDLNDDVSKYIYSVYNRIKNRQVEVNTNEIKNKIQILNVLDRYNNNIFNKQLKDNKHHKRIEKSIKHFKYKYPLIKDYLYLSEISDIKNYINSMYFYNKQSNNKINT